MTDEKQLLDSFYAGLICAKGRAYSHKRGLSFQVPGDPKLVEGACSHFGVGSVQGGVWSVGWRDAPALISRLSTHLRGSFAKFAFKQLEEVRRNG